MQPGEAPIRDGLRRRLARSLDPLKYEGLSQAFQVASLTSSKKLASDGVPAAEDPLGGGRAYRQARQGT